MPRTAATTPASRSQMVLSVGELVKKREILEATESEAWIP